MNLRFTLPVIFAFIFQIGFVVDAEAQDPRFSQFYAAPMQLNPAMTGVFEGRWRFNANYRDQWRSILETDPFQTVAASFDMRYHIVGDDFIGFGFSALRDEAGTSKFNINRGHLSLSYMKQVGGGKYRTDDQYLIAGGSFGFGQNSIDDQLWFSKQYNGNTNAPDFGQSSGEAFDTVDPQSSDIYMDVNAGLMYYALFGKNTSVYVGGAMNHLNAPNVSLLENGKEELYTRWLGHAGGEIPFTTELSLLPAVQVMGQGPSFESTFGANIRFSNHDWYELAIRAGLWARMTNTVEGKNVDALIVAFILEVEKWNLGLSYDITTSNLNEANDSRGAFELSLIYTHPAQSRIKVNCPKF